VDTAVVTITFANGCLGVIDNSRRAAYGYDQRVEVFGSKGALACGNDTPSSVTLANETGVAGDKPLYFFLERYRQAFIDEMNAFFEMVLDGKASPVGEIDGLKPLLMGLAAKKSVVEGRPVRIAEVDI
jgi:myo-inositol 2-dehydrogenase/D-chiro-inositol 1-dehydrogenase